MSRSARTNVRPLVAPLPIIAALAAATLALSGCASQSAPPAVSFPTASAPPAFNLDATTGAAAGGQSVADSISVKIIDLGSPAVGSYQSGWTTFTVVVSNGSATDVANFVPLVVFGPCTCDPTSGAVPPRSILQVYDATTGAWGSAASVSTDAGDHFTFEHQVAQETLGAHQSLTFQYRVTLSGSGLTGMRDGTGSIQAYAMQQPGHRRLTDATGPDATVPLTYDVS
jgi:hypothetical protein